MSVLFRLLHIAGIRVYIMIASKSCINVGRSNLKTLCLLMSSISNLDRRESLETAVILACLNFIVPRSLLGK